MIGAGSALVDPRGSDNGASVNCAAAGVASSSKRQKGVGQAHLFRGVAVRREENRTGERPVALAARRRWWPQQPEADGSHVAPGDGQVPPERGAPTPTSTSSSVASRRTRSRSDVPLTVCPHRQARGSALAPRVGIIARATVDAASRPSQPSDAPAKSVSTRLDKFIACLVLIGS